MRFLIASIMAFLCLSSGHLYAFDFFETDIDYWNKPKVKKEHSNTNTAIASKEEAKVAEKKSDSFDWKKQLDPKNDAFFKEGDHTPPAAFMELARNPTDQNITNWFKLIEKKNLLSQRLSQRIAEYVKKNKKLKPEEKIALTETKQELPQSTDDYKRFRFRMYFESSCPHCKRMFQTMKELQEMGYFVELKQIDDNTEIRRSLPFAVTQASKEELKNKNINSWPVLFIGDLKKKVTYRLNGYRSTTDVISAIQSR